MHQLIVPNLSVNYTVIYSASSDFALNNLVSFRVYYLFHGYVFSIDYVHGDLNAASSQVSVHMKDGDAKFPIDLWNTLERRISTEDFLLRGLCPARIGMV